MKILIFLILSITLVLNNLAQEPGHNIKFVFVDSTGKTISPNICVSSKQIDYNTNKVIDSELYCLKTDSLMQIKNSILRYSDKVYMIPPIVGGYWLDREYSIKLTYNNQVMNINFITSGFSISDTIEFNNGNYNYLHKGLSFDQPIILNKSKLINLTSNDFCSLNCSGEIINLDFVTKNLILKSSISSYPEFLVINNVPIGILIWNFDENKVSINYFSDSYIELLRNNFN